MVINAIVSHMYDQFTVLYYPGSNEQNFTDLCGLNFESLYVTFAEARVKKLTQQSDSLRYRCF